MTSLDDFNNIIIFYQKYLWISAQFFRNGSGAIGQHLCVHFGKHTLMQSILHYLCIQVNVPLLIVQEQLDNIFVSIAACIHACSRSYIISWIQVNVHLWSVKKQFDIICVSIFASINECSPSKNIACIQLNYVRLLQE